MSDTTGVRVLIVDDQIPFREAMRMVVDISNGFEYVGEAVDGADAVALADELEPDLVLIDVQMPVMDGLAATREIRARHEATRVFVLSTHESGNHASSALAAGAAAFIPKSSFSMEVLVDTWASASAESATGSAG